MSKFMPQRRRFLKPDVIAEPLVDRWYAWPHILSPTTAAMNVAKRHLRIMESFVSAPSAHSAAVKNPALRGGPFVDLDVTLAEEVRRLLEDTRRRRGAQLEFSEAVTEANRLLMDKADGGSLEGLYSQMPEALRGYIELVYDLDSRPALRFLEPLIYRSRYYDRKAQSIMLSRVAGDDRPFILSTPRLNTRSGLHFDIPFEEPALDTLMAGSHRPFDVGELAEMLDLDAQGQLQLDAMLTDDTPPPPPPRYEGRGIRWRYMGHACVLIEGSGTTIMTDPIVSHVPGVGEDRYSIFDLPERIDFVLITHNHQDHVLIETLLRLRHKIGTIVVPPCAAGCLQDPSLRLMLKAIGFPRVVELDILDTIDLDGGGTIAGLPFLGEHGDLDIRSKLSYLIRFDGHSMMLAADSKVIEPRIYQHVRDFVGDLDLLFIGLECDGAPLSWVYGPLLTTPLARRLDQTRRTNGSDHAQALELVETLNCREVFVYAMGQEPWLNFISCINREGESLPIRESRLFIEACRERGIPAQRLYGMQEGNLGGGRNFL